uniref:transposase n=1 Tax=Streptomyces polyasparticus TaxID=2767826 RepID=UPI001BE45C32
MNQPLAPGWWTARASGAAERGGWHGYDGGKKVLGIKRHLLVDTGGLVLAVCVSPANVGDRDGAAGSVRR